MNDEIHESEGLSPSRLKSMDVLIETLKIIHNTDVVLFAAFLGYIGAVFGSKGFTTISLFSLLSYVISIVFVFVCMCCSIWPLWDEDIDLEKRSIRYTFGASLTFLLLGMIFALIFVVRFELPR